MPTIFLLTNTLPAHLSTDPSGICQMSSPPLVMTDLVEENS
jgi:hypothetical protein